MFYSSNNDENVYNMNKEVDRINRTELELIDYISRSDNEVDISKVSKSFDVSERYIRQLIKNINIEMASFGKNLEIILKQNKIYLSNNYILEIALENLKIYNYRLNQRERLIIISLLAFISKDVINYEDVRNLLDTSKTTMFSDIEKLDAFLGNYDIEVIKMPGGYLKFQYKYEIASELVIKFLETDRYIIRIFINSLIDNPIADVSFTKNDYVKFSATIDEIERSNSLSFSTKSRYKLSNYIILMYLINYNRHSQGYEIPNNLSTITTSIKEILSQNLKFDMTYIDVINLEKIISSLSYKEEVHDGPNSPTIQLITKKFISLVSNELDMPFHEDFELFSNLSSHLLRVSHEDGNNYQDIIDINSIVSDAEDISFTIYDNIFYIEEAFERELSHAEISYILIYFYGAYEKLKQAEIQKLNVVIVCNSGIGTSQLLKLKINQLFNFNNISVFKRHEVSEEILVSSDLVISTVSLVGMIKNCININPILTENDLKLIRDHVDNIVRYEINQSYNNKKTKNSNLDTKLDGPSITEFLTKDFIEIVNNLDKWEDSIIKAGEVLVSNNIVRPQYIQECIENVKLNGPYIVIADGTALPHAAISHLVIKTAFSIVISKKPIYFDNQKKLAVNFIILLAATDKDSHLKALYEISLIFSNDKFKQNLLKSDNSVQAENVIKYYVDQLSKES